MIAASLELAAVYLLLGFLASTLLRKGRPQDWDEGILAAIVALPMLILIAAAVVTQFARDHLDGGSGPAAHA